MSFSMEIWFVGESEEKGVRYVIIPRHKKTSEKTLKPISGHIKLCRSMICWDVFLKVG